MVAPPATFRAKQDFVTTASDYVLSIGPSCTYGAASCKNPGYKIQWPYMQSSLQSGGSVDVPPAIQSACTLKRGGASGWMWDFSRSRLLREYWDCGSLSSIQFQDGDGVPFHFEPGETQSRLGAIAEI